MCGGGGQGDEDEDDEQLVAYATGLFNRFKGQATLVSFERLDALIAELHGAVHLARQLVIGKASANPVQELHQSSKASVDGNEEMLPVEVFSHELVQWGEDGSDLGVLASVFGTEAANEVGDKTSEDDPAWMASGQNYIFEDLNFEEVESGFEFPPS